MAREEAPRSADGLSECRRWAASPPGSGRSTGLAGAVLGARGEQQQSPPGRGGFQWECCGASAHPKAADPLWISPGASEALWPPCPAAPPARAAGARLPIADATHASHAALSRA